MITSLPPTRLPLHKPKKRPAELHQKVQNDPKAKSEKQGVPPEVQTQTRQGVAQKESQIKASQLHAFSSKGKLSQAQKPVLVMASQYGDGAGDQMIKNGHDLLKSEAQKNGFQVIDAANLSGEALQKKVESELPKGYKDPLNVYVGGHGSVVKDDIKNATEHEISTTNEDGTQREVRTNELMRSIYDAAQNKSPEGHEAQMSAMIGSCNSGEALSDFRDTFSKQEQQNIAMVASSTKDQFSWGVTQGSHKNEESATVEMARMLRSNSPERQSADVNNDGALSVREFQKRTNAHGGGIAASHSNTQDATTGLSRQKIQIAGNTSLPLIPKTIGKVLNHELPKTTTEQEAGQHSADAMNKYRATQGAEMRFKGTNEKSNPGVFKHIVDKNTRVFFPDDEQRRMVERKSSDDKGRSLTTLTSKSGTQEVMRDGTHGTTTHKDLQGKIERQTQDQYDDKGRLQSWRTSVLKKEGVREESWKRDSESKSQTKTIEYDDGTKYQKTSFERAAAQSEQEVWRNKKGEVLREVQQFRRGEKAGIFDTSIDRRRGHDGVYRRGIRSSTGAVRYEDDNGRALNNEEINRFYNREAQRHMQGAAA